MEALVVDTVVTPEALLEHWQGHRRLTRKVIEAFPEDKLFTYSIGGMRPFATLAQEMIEMAAPGIEGIVTRTWSNWGESKETITSKAELLEHWDTVTEKLNDWWKKIPQGRLQENDKAFNMWDGPVYGTLLYIIDNEIHHRGQGYVYLRSLGIEPPHFWERVGA